MPAGVRSTTRSTAPTPFPRRTAPRRARAYNPMRGAEGHRLGAQLSRRGRAARRRELERRARLLGRGRQARCRARRRQEHRPEAAREIRRLSRRHVRARPVPAEKQRHPYRGADRRQFDDRQERPGAYLGRVAGIGADDDPGFRGFDRRRRRRGQGRRLPQLARPDEGRPQGRGREGRQDLYPKAQSGPRLHGA